MIGKHHQTEITQAGQQISLTQTTPEEVVRKKVEAQISVIHMKQATVSI